MTKVDELIGAMKRGENTEIARDTYDRNRPFGGKFFTEEPDDFQMHMARAVEAGRAAALTDLQAQVAGLREALGQAAAHLDGYDSTLGDLARQALAQVIGKDRDDGTA